MQFIHIGTAVLILFGTTACMEEKDRIVYSIEKENDKHSDDIIYNHPYKNFESCQKELHIIKEEALAEYKVRMERYNAELANGSSRAFISLLNPGIDSPLSKYRCIENNLEKIKRIYGENSDRYKRLSKR